MTSDQPSESTFRMSPRRSTPALAVAALVALLAGCPAPPAAEPEQRRSVRAPGAPAERPSGATWEATSPTPGASPTPRPSGFAFPPRPSSSPGQITSVEASDPGPCQRPGEVGTLLIAGEEIKPSGAAVAGDGRLWVSSYGTHEVLELEWTAGCEWKVARRFGGTSAELNDPRGLAFDVTGRWLHVADYANHRVRRLDTRSVASKLETLAGEGIGGFADGPAASAWFWHPAGVAVDAAGAVYVADSYNHRIRKIAGGRVTTVVGGETGTGPHQLAKPAGVAVQLPPPNASPTPAPSLLPGEIAPSADVRPILFVADTENHRVVRFAPPGPSPSPAASGQGQGSTSVIGAPGSQWIAEVIAGAAGEKSFADGKADVARLAGPTGLIWDGGALWVADTGNHAIRRIGGAILPAPTTTTFAGTGGSGDLDGALRQATFRFPGAVARGKRGEVFVADTDNGRVRVARGEQEAP